MGWFDGASEVSDKHHHHKKSSSSHHRSSSHGRSSPRASSIFGLGDHKHNSSRSSFFNYAAGRSSSYYKRSPRQGYVNRIFHKLRRLLRDLMYYMKKHPMKVFMLVIMPLLTSGAVVGLLAKFGIRLPGGIEKMFGGNRGGGIGMGRGGGLQFERTKIESRGGGIAGAMGGLGSVVGGMGGIGGAVSLAKMFM